MGNDQKNALTAIVLSGAILFGWQYFFGTPGADFIAPEIAKKESTQLNTPPVTTASNTTIEVKPGAVEETSFSFESKNLSLDITSKLLITSAHDKLFNIPLDKVIKGSKYQFYFEIDGEYRKLNFAISQTNNVINFTNATYGISGSIGPSDSGYAHISILSVSPIRFKTVVYNDSAAKAEESILPSVGDSKQIKFFYNGEDFETINVDSTNSGDEKLSWFGIEANFQIFALIFDSERIVKHSISDQSFEVITSKVDIKFDADLIFTQKAYDNLKGLGHNLHLTLDYGIWALIAVPILRGLQFFYSFFGNYGLAIIFLTIAMRFLTFPLQYKSFKSMKKMQLIQPEMAKLKERYKDDPARMQKETMALFKKSGANPLGGCLPMILQMPIFFAFYRVLFTSVELVEAPFIFWITDLSQKDPYYVLPVLMALAMVLNQKMMPSTSTDPTQKKMMMFMPLIFVVFMKDFPAGLTLYTVVSTIVGMLQQLFVYKRT